MQKENLKTSHTDVMPAVAIFLSEVTFEGNLKNLPSEMQEINNLLLETEQANQLHVREKMLRCQKFILDFCQVMKPFSMEQVETACKENGNV
jgi:hypothetical protein